MSKKSFLLLGYGYTAQYIEKEILKKIPEAQIFTTSRKGAPRISFDLNDPSTWDHLPEVDGCFLTFPAEPLKQLQTFYEKYKNQLGKWVVIGSTSAFQITKDGENVNEQSTLDLSIPRVKGEKFLMDQGATLVMSAGIYGPKRQPLDWVKKGLVGRSSRWLNLIHVEDLAQIVTQAMFIGKKGAMYVAANGDPQKWSDLIDQWEKKGVLKNTPVKTSPRLAKKVDPTQTLTDLHISLRFPHLSDLIS